MGFTLPFRPVGAALLAAAVAALPAAAIDQRQPAQPPRTWYVDNTAAADGDGSMVAPFDRLARAERAADAGDTIYVFRGDGTSRGLDDGIRLRPFQRLIGSGAALEVAGTPTLPPGERPLLGGDDGPALSLAAHVRVEGLAIAAGRDVAIAGDGVADVHLADLRVDGGLRLRDPRGLVRIEATDLRGRGGAALSVESTTGEARIELHGVSLAGEAADGLAASAASAASGAATEAPRDGHPSPIDAVATAVEAGASTATALGNEGLFVRAAGDAVLTVTATATVLEHVAGNAVTLSAGGRSRLRFELSGSGLLGELHARAAVALSALAREDGVVEVAARGNDLLARDTGLLLSAYGRGRLSAELLANVVGGAGMARGVVMLLGDRADGALSLVGNRVAGQRAEAVYAVAAAQATLSVAGRDNDLASGTAGGPSPFAALLVETRDGSRACVSLADNRFAAGNGTAPAVALRQRDASALALGGGEAALAGVAASPLTAGSGLGRIEVLSDRPLAPAAGLPCQSPSATEPAAVAAAAE